MHQEWKRDQLLVTTDPARIDVDAIHAYLSRAYWCVGIPHETVENAVRHSLCFGLFDGAAQVGLARLVTDHATFAYLCDVYVLESHRGRGLGKWLIECVMAHPCMPGLRRIMLVTNDAHELYRGFGFVEATDPQKLMEIRRPNIYQQPRK